ncbi:MAG: phage-shock protein [Desulfotomaculaceae bacterium]|nr:phage-shock protein [Desulfotomaculaceae bacterium]
MGGRLNSLTDVLKKTLFFFESLTVAELTPYVHRKMLKDYSLPQVEEKVKLCLSQHPCFSQERDNWRLNLEGLRENDQFYALLLKKGQPQNLRDLMKKANAKKRKTKTLLAEEALLISDGRFVQLDNGYWGLSEWEVETNHYSLKHLIIKAMKMHPGGLSVQQILDVISSWRFTERKTIDGVLRKFPYFELVGEEVWSYNPTAHLLYDDVLRRFLNLLSKQKLRWRQERSRWKDQIESVQNSLREAMSGQREVAAALAEKMELAGQHDYLLTQMAEKDLLLSLRKREIFRYREHVKKLESKANCILYQCRLWVKRARDAQEDLAKMRVLLSKNQSNQEGLFIKLQQYKGKDRENKSKLMELREKHANKVAELQTEIVELKQKLERERAAALLEERRMMEEISKLSSDLKKALRSEEEYQRAQYMAKQELAATRDGLKALEERLKNPLVRLIINISSLFKRFYPRKPV